MEGTKTIWNDFDTYFEAVKQRNRETHQDGHLIVFEFEEEVLDKEVEWFKGCWKAQMSAHIALTLFSHNDLP